MKKEYINKQLQSYEEGLTSSAEEKELLSLLSNSGKGANSWFRYIQAQKKPVPQNLENDIWLTIQNREQKKKRMLIKISSIAASVILAVSIFLSIMPLNKKEMSYDEKIAAIEEAMAMISEPQEEIIFGEILYEDEILIIYTK